MAGRRDLYVVIAGGTFSLFVAGSLLAQDPAPKVAPRESAPQPPAPAPASARFRDMSPEDRQRFQSNIERWKQMPPEERRELRTREGWRRERLKREADEALRDSGLELEAERRRQYEQRYIDERRRIERALRQELAEKRKRELAPVVEQLKKEFQQPQRPSSPVAPTATKEK